MIWLRNANANAQRLERKTALLRNNQCPHCEAMLAKAQIFFSVEAGWRESLACPNLHFAFVYFVDRASSEISVTQLDELGPPITNLDKRIKWF